ncbi:helix-turn-helix domain-containing protein [Arthrobacter methylotrophus]|uniref:Helix-turn-helix domain-containing protein n=2 Tax=Arthrobacter methylotrophus TaxID=121291 RepID=A0ABV5UP96_9MICC
MTVDQAAAELNVSENQIRSLLRTGELRGIRVGGRGVWRIGTADLESYIEDAYTKTAARIASGDIEDLAEDTGGDNG